VQRMRTRRFLFSIAILTAFAGAGVAPAAASPTKSWIHDGYYSALASTEGAGNSYVVLWVGGNGTRLLGGQKGGFYLTCTVSPALIALDPNELVANLSKPVIALPRSIAISPSGAFSYKGDVTLYPYDTGTTMTFSLPITLSGHFIKGKIVADKTTAVVVRISAPEICEAATPTTFSDQWVGAHE
jgi:hypothetical protein